MAIRNIIARGFGFSPGTSAAIVTGGYGSFTSTPDLIAPVIQRVTIDGDGNFSVTGAGGGGTLADHYQVFFSPTPGIDPADSGTYEDLVEVADLSAPITGGPVASTGVRYYFVLAELNADDSEFEASAERSASPISGNPALLLLLLDD